MTTMILIHKKQKLIKKIKWLIVATVFLFTLLISQAIAHNPSPVIPNDTAKLVAQSSFPATQNKKPARIIFFHIDGLHYQAPERLKMTNYQSLVQQGTSVDEAYILIPWHQTENGFRSLSLTSPPNPTTMAGSIFLDPWWSERYIQQAFYPKQLTAHIANSTAYSSLNPSFNFVKLERTNDESSVHFALDLLRQHDIRFMRLVLQDTGSASQEVADGRLENKSWAENIWANGSPYIKATQIKEHLRLKSQMQLLADRYPLIDTSLMQAENRLERPEANFYNLERMDQWHEAGTINNMLRVNQKAIAFLRQRLEKSGAPKN